MRQSYVRNNKDISDNIKTDAFAGSSQGYGTDILKTLLATYKGYKDIPPDLRWKWFGDRRALVEDQNSKNPMIDKETGDYYKYPFETESTNEEEEIDYENGDNVNSSSPYESKRPTDEYRNAQSVYEDAKVRNSDDYKASMEQAAENGSKKKSTKITSVAPNMKGDKDENGNFVDEFGNPMTEDEVKEAQQFLVDRNYDLGNTGKKKNGVDGDWGVTSEAAYEKYLEENPNGEVNKFSRGYDRSAPMYSMSGDGASYGKMLDSKEFVNDNNDWNQESAWNTSNETLQSRDSKDWKSSVPWEDEEDWKSADPWVVR